MLGPTLASVVRCLGKLFPPAMTAPQPTSPAPTPATQTQTYQNLARAEMRAFIPPHATRLLDVGCNTGSFGAGLKASRAIEVWGLEPNADAAVLAGQALDRVLHCAFDAQANLPAQHFDVISFNDVLEHFADPWAALHLAKSLLRPGGVVVVSVPNLLNKQNLAHMLVERDFRYEADGIRDRTHLRFFTQKSLRRTFEESGFQVLTLQGINEDWYSSSIWLRLAYRVFSRQLDETKYRQLALVARPDAPAAQSA